MCVYRSGICTCYTDLIVHWPPSGEWDYDNNNELSIYIIARSWSDVALTRNEDCAGYAVLNRESV